ncbi:uncharacterized protein LOC114579658 [Dendrobium catenatum]|uniref:uncharacterized protein LOC114579658 n=1 Tax=Dendrobium catenatum TaxID=906689 RepID=UPI00109F72CE|nr:uncharacterized protein LOC114579658 [Dendrobium catenatum]
MAYLLCSVLSVFFCVIMDLPDPDMINGQSASQAAPVGRTTPMVGSDTLSQFATLIAQMMSETQSRASTVRSEDIYKHLQLFLRLKPPRKVPLAVFLLDGEAEHWWIGQSEVKFQGKLNSLITWEEFFEEFRSWFVPPSARQQMQETFLRLIQGSRTVMQYEAEFTTLARYAPQLCFRTTGQCFKCGQPRHRIVECPQAGFDRRSEFRSDSRPVGSVGRPRTVPQRTMTEGSSGGRGGGSSSVARRPPTGSQRESSGLVAPAPVQPRVYSLSQQEARDAPDVVIGTIYIFDQPCRVLFNSGASHLFLSERCFDALHMDSILLPVSLSVILPARSNLIA